MQRYIILAQPRTRSTFLASALGADTSEPCHLPGTKASKAAAFGQSARRFAGLVMHDHHHEATDGYFPDHFADPQMKCACRFRLVWLSRQDKFAQAASWYVSQTTGEWFRPHDATRPVELNAETMAKWALQQCAMRERLRAAMDYLPSIETTHEQLVDFAELLRVANFVGCQALHAPIVQESGWRWTVTNESAARQEFDSLMQGGN